MHDRSYSAFESYFLSGRQVGAGTVFNSDGLLKNKTTGLVCIGFQLK